MSYSIDLHTHTNTSDGKLTPTELVNEASERNVTSIAITDHETVAGIDEAKEAGKEKNIKIIPGIEISCDGEFKDTHIIGIFIDYKNKELQSFCENVRNQRIEQKIKMIRKLQQLGFNITFDEVATIATFSFGRPHIAQVLADKYPERFKGIPDVFDQYLGRGKPAYLDREMKVPLEEGIRIINAAGGIAILAHPLRSFSGDVERLIALFKEKGGQGVETNYRYDLIEKCTKEESDKMNQKLAELAEKYNILQSGGSDFHGRSGRENAVVGSAGVDENTFEKLKKTSQEEEK
jgi:3',5'-nucleoside bisphosphate phosphatase